MPDLRGHRALITGASSGIGREMARLLAAWGCDLTISARRGERLDALAEELSSQHGVEVRAAVFDLAEPGSAEALHRDTRDAGEDIDILINNAGFGRYQAFQHLPWREQADMIQLNVTSLVELCHLFVPTMLTGQKRAYILNVASIAAYQPVPYFATYAASKSFVRDFSEALAHELAGTQVSVTCLCPGGTQTEFFEHSGQTLGAIARATTLSAQAVARKSLRAMLRGRRNIVTGWMNVITCFLMRFIPRRAAAAGSVVVLDVPAPPQDTSSADATDTQPPPAPLTKDLP